MNMNSSLLSHTLDHLKTARTHHLERIQSSGNSVPTVGIVGLGPIGSLAALEAFRLGKNVVASEKRKTYTREQVLYLSADEFSYIKGLFGPKENLLSQAIQKGIIRRDVNHSDSNPLSQGEVFFSVVTKDLEKLINKVVDAVAIENPSQFKVFRGELGTISKSSTQGDLKIENAGYFKVDEIIATDGLSSQIRKATGVQQLDMSTPNDFFIMSLKIPKNIHYREYLNHPKKSQNLKLVRGLGWNKQRSPIDKFLVTQDTVYIGGEIPEGLKNEVYAIDRQLTHLKENKQILESLSETDKMDSIISENRQYFSRKINELSLQKQGLLKLWGDALLKKYLPDTMISSLTPKYASAFSGNMKVAAKPSGRTPSGVKVNFMGDALINGNFLAGSGGVVTGINALEAWREVEIERIHGNKYSKHQLDNLYDFRAATQAQLKGLNWAFVGLNHHRLKGQPNGQFKTFKQSIEKMTLAPEFKLNRY